MGQVNVIENRSKISISAESREEADKLFNGLSEGGQVEMPLKTVLGVHILECLETNLELSGWLTLTQNITKSISRKQRTHKSGLAKAGLLWQI